MSRFGEELNEILLHTYRAVNAVEGATLRNAMGGSLSISEMHVIECIDREREKSVTDIAQELRITAASATMSIKKLEKRASCSRRRAQRTEGASW